MKYIRRFIRKCLGIWKPHDEHFNYVKGCAECEKTFAHQVHELCRKYPGCWW